MKVVKTIAEVREQVKQWRAEGLSVGLVPTMGYLHEGHASLIDTSYKHNDKTVVSVFVNPMQFSPNEDLESYPRDLEHDKALAKEYGCDMIFNPEPDEMYHKNFYERAYRGAMRNKPSDTFQGSMYSCEQAVQHRATRQGIFRQKRRTAACSNTSYG